MNVLKMCFMLSLSLLYVARGCFLTGAQQPGAPKNVFWVPNIFAAAPKTFPVGLLTSWLLPFWAP